MLAWIKLGLTAITGYLLSRPVSCLQSGVKQTPAGDRSKNVIFPTEDVFEFEEGDKKRARLVNEQLR